MATPGFDHLTQNIGDILSRRGMLKASALTTAGLGLGLATSLGTDAKKNKKKRKKKNKNNNQPQPNPDATGQLVRSAKATADACIAGASGTLQIFKQNGVERMVVDVNGLPANTPFDVFVIENPDAPFGFSWYQGDLTTGGNGSGSQTFIGRFNDETFVLDAAEAVHKTFHVGVWFNSPADAVAAGCSGGTTPFNGEQNAGIQALTTVPVNGQGPLAQLG